MFMACWWPYEFHHFLPCPSPFWILKITHFCSSMYYLNLLASDLWSFWLLERFTLAEVFFPFSFLSLLSLLCGSFLSLVRSWLPCRLLLFSGGDEHGSRSIVTSLWMKQRKKNLAKTLQSSHWTYYPYRAKETSTVRRDYRVSRQLKQRLQDFAGQ